MTDVRERETSDLSRAHFEHLAGVAAARLAVDARFADEAGEEYLPGDFLTEEFSRVAQRAAEFPEDPARVTASLPRIERRRLELDRAEAGRAPAIRSRAQLEAAAAYVGQLHHLAMTVGFDRVLDLGPEIRSRIADLQEELITTAEELVLEIGRILLAEGDRLEIGDREVADAELREIEVREASAARGPSLTLVH
jgi:hypothetical protein